MILLSAGAKARHRGAGLVRNLMFSATTRGNVAQVTSVYIGSRTRVMDCVCMFNDDLKGHLTFMMHVWCIFSRRCLA